MRIWSVHPEYLDPKGLVACWRETLLAQKVLRGLTKGYRNHPQLVRFRALPDPVAGIGAYLDALEADARARGYRFNRDLIDLPPPGDAWLGALDVTEGQVAHEFGHLRAKLAERDPARLEATQWAGGPPPRLHPLFRLVPGPVADWEIV